MLAGQHSSRGDLLSHRLSPCPCLLGIGGTLDPFQPCITQNPKLDKQRGMTQFGNAVTALSNGTSLMYLFSL